MRKRKGSPEACCPWAKSWSGLLAVACLAAAVPAYAGGDERWSFEIGAGVMTSGDLLETVTDDGTTEILWKYPGSTTKFFPAAGFMLTLDEDFDVGGSVSYRFSELLTYRAEMAWSEADATAEARVGEGVDLFLYDRMRYRRLGITAEVALFRAPNRAYALLGLSLVNLDFRGADDLDQSGAGYTIGAGYQHRLASEWFLKLEIRDTVFQAETADYDPPHLTDPVGFQVKESGPQHLVELTAGLSIRL